MSVSRLRVAVFGTGYWAQFQIPAWQSIGCDVVAVWNRSADKAHATAEKFGIASVHEDAEEIFLREKFDLCDIVADAPAHEPLVALAARHGMPVICQKPMATDLAACVRMVGTCRKAGVWFAIHENFRYQPQFEAVWKVLDSGRIGTPLHAHVQMKSPDRAIIDKQPALAQMDHMALRDMGPHIFDTVRMLFGNIVNVHTRSVVSYPDIGVEDSCLSLLTMKTGMPVLCTLGHSFPYKVFVEASAGSLILEADNLVTVTGVDGRIETIDPRGGPRLPYIPGDDWEIHGGHVFTAIPRCLIALRDRFLAGKSAETSGDDNLETMRTVFAAIRSQDEDRVVRLQEMNQEALS